MDENTTPVQPHDPQPEPPSGAWWAAGDGRTSREPQPAPDYGQAPYGYASAPYSGQLQSETLSYGTASGPGARALGGSVLTGSLLPEPMLPGSAAAPRRSASWMRRGAAAAVLALVAVGSGTAGAVISQELDSNDGVVAAAAPFGQTAPAAATAPVQSLAQVAAKVTPSVVSISYTSTAGSGQGSGVILTADGQILTNNHVVAGAAGGGEITVRFADGKSAKATILGRDPSTDLAVIQAQDVSGLTPATLGSSSDLHVGDTVLAVGNPLGLEGSVSAGIVSALDRSVDIPTEEEQSSPEQMFPGSPFGQQEDGATQQQSSGTVLKGAIQTDAAVNPGNSGGALVDAAGRLVGINSAIASLSSGSSQSGSIGLGFAIPIDTAKTIAAQLAKGETVQHPRLGVSIGDSTTGSAGAEVGTVVAGSGAAKAGLAVGDVITAIDGTEVRGSDGLQAAIAGHRPGDTVSVTFTRDGSSRTVSVVLGAAES